MSDMSDNALGAVISICAAAVICLWSVKNCERSRGEVEVEQSEQTKRVQACVQGGGMVLGEDCLKCPK